MSTKLAIKKFLEFYNEAVTKEYIVKPVSWALYQTWKWADSKERMRKESEYHADPYHADFAWDVKTVIDNFRKESE